MPSDDASKNGPDDRRVYDAYIAGRQSVALAAAVRVGLFNALEAGPLTVEALAARIDRRERPVGLLVRVLRAMGLLQREGDRVRLSEEAAVYLVSGKPDSLAGLIDLEVERFPTPERVLEALRHDRATVYGETDPWERHAREPEQARRFTEAMHSISARPARTLARTLDLSTTRRLLDVGGGSGVVSIEIARAWPKLECVIWDLPTVCAVARRFVEENDVAERVRVLEGDMFADPFPRGFDAVGFSQILHDWSPGTGERLLRGAFDALEPGGLVFVHEKLVSADGPLANALVDLDMLVWTEGQQYDSETLRALLKRAGFAAIERRATTGYWSVVTGRRP